MSVNLIVPHDLMLCKSPTKKLFASFGKEQETKRFCCDDSLLVISSRNILNREASDGNMFMKVMQFHVLVSMGLDFGY